MLQCWPSMLQYSCSWNCAKNLEVFNSQKKKNRSHTISMGWTCSMINITLLFFYFRKSALLLVRQILHQGDILSKKQVDAIDRLVAKDQLTCDACAVGVRLLQVLLDNGVGEKIISEVAIQVCRAVSIIAKPMCLLYDVTKLWKHKQGNASFFRFTSKIIAFAAWQCANFATWFSTFFSTWNQMR